MVLQKEISKRMRRPTKSMTKRKFADLEKMVREKGGMPVFYKKGKRMRMTREQMTNYLER